MEIVVVIVTIVEITLVALIYAIMSLRRHILDLEDKVKVTNKLVNTVLQSVGTTQSQLKSRVVSTPGPRLVKPKVSQRYDEVRGAEPGTKTAAYERQKASGRVGAVKQTRRGGKTGDTGNSGPESELGSTAAHDG